MANPKCILCGKEVDRKTAYKVKKGSKNIYYCNKEEYDEWVSAEKEIDNFTHSIWYLIEEVLDTKETYSWKEIRGMISDLHKKYSLDQIEGYLESETDRISHILKNKSFSNNYAMTRYYIAVVKNNIDVYYKDFDSEEEEIPQIKIVEDFYMTPPKYKQIKRRAMIDIEKLGDDDG